MYNMYHMYKMHARRLARSARTPLARFLGPDALAEPGHEHEHRSSPGFDDSSSTSKSGAP